MKNTVSHGNGKDSIGRCRLCHTEGVPLLRSHVLSAWAYRRLRRQARDRHGGFGKSPDPIFVANGRAVQTSRQVVERLLCSACEQRLGIAEKYAAKVAYQADNSADFCFDRILREGSNDSVFPLPARAPELDLDQLARFASGFLWRAHISKQITGCQLGERYGDEFRRYLLEEEEFPMNAAVILQFYEDTPGARRARFGRTCVFPESARAGAFHIHTLVVCGMRFTFAVGQGIDQEFREFCIVRGPDRCIILTSAAELIEEVRMTALKAMKARSRY
jgi:hypothetical protein